MSNDDTRTSRRDFLRTASGAALAAALGACGGEPQEPVKPKPKPATKKESIFSGIALTDQHGKPFDPAQLEQALVLFGYGGCPMCQNISDSVAAIQDKLLAEGKQVPIVVVSVQPEEDKKDLKTYVASYYVKGVKQFASEKLPPADDARRLMGEKAFDAAEKLPQRDRILHVVCPPDSDAAKMLQTQRMGYAQNPKNPESHTPYITLVKQGVVVKNIRALPYDNGAPDKQFLQDVSNEVSGWIPAPERGR